LSQKNNIDFEVLLILRNTNREKWLSAIYDYYASALHGVVYRIVGDHTEAEEVLQNVFCKVWEKADQYDPDKGRLFTWLLQIARNSAIDHTRSKNFRKSQVTNTIDDHILQIQNDLREEINVNSIGIKEFTQILKRNQKEIIDLIYFQGYTQSEVAKELGIPLGTVKTRVRYAIKELRKAMTN